MDTERNDIPEEYVDMLTQEFAYDPVRLPPTEDPAQILYNRRTLETIWDSKHEATNPFTRQSFDINNVIPQAELRQEMHRYIVNGSGRTQSLDVIPDYTQVLSEPDMKKIMMELIWVYQCLVNADKEDREVQAEHFWKMLWQKFNLLRLYCQYRRENRNVFCSIRGYEYLSQIVNGQFCYLCCYHLSSCDVLKEVCRLVDLIGLEDTDFPQDLLVGVSTALCCLVSQCDHLKIQGMILRIYRRMFYDLNIENIPRRRLNHFCSSTVHVTLYTLERENLSDIANEDLYNGMAILKAAWMENRLCRINSKFDYVCVLVNSVTLCITRLHYLHHVAITDECRPRMMKKNEVGDAARNVDLISVALEGGLYLINSIITTTSQEEEEEFFSEAKEALQASDIVTQIVGMVDLVLAGFKRLGSSHLQFGIIIVAALLRQEGCERRGDAVRAFGDFLGSDMVDEYDSHVKLLLQEFIRNAHLSEQT